MNERDDLRELLGSYVLGHLDGDELIHVEEALATDAALRAEAEQLRAVAGLLDLADAEDLAPADRSVPDGLDDSVVAELAASRAGDVAEPGHEGGGGGTDVGGRSAGGRIVVGVWPRLGRAVVPLAAGAVAIAVGLGVVVGGDTPEAGLGVAEPIGFEVASEGLRVDAQLVPHTWGTEVFLDMVGLRDGEVYRLDLIGVDGAEVSAGTFVGDADLEVICVMNGALLREDVAAVVVTTDDGAHVMRANLDPVRFRSV